MNSKQITIIGSGNVAWHIGHAIKKSSYNIAHIISRNKETGAQLAKELQCEYVPQIEKVKQTQFVILAVSDSSLEHVIKEVNFGNSIALHTAGSIPMNVFNGAAEKYGVLYPYQTFTKGVHVDFNQVPLCIEASTQEIHKEIEMLAKELSSATQSINSEQRKILHLAGIMANNFTNHFVAQAGDLLKKHNIEASLILPLLHETIAKLEKTSAYDAQTGPARRNDRNIIETHLELLKDMPELKNLYRSISDSIIAYYS